MNANVPLPGKMFRDYRNESFETAKDRTMYNNRPVVRLFGRPVLEVEALRKLEIELDGGALERTAQGIANGDVDLWTVEGAITGVQVPFTRIMFLKR